MIYLYTYLIIAAAFFIFLVGERVGLGRKIKKFDWADLVVSGLTWILILIMYFGCWLIERRREKR